MTHDDLPPFELFVYGSLKPGESGHGLFCAEVRSVRARVRGALFEAPEGYPVLFVAEGDVLAEGTENPVEDARRALAHGPASPRAPAEHANGIPLRWIDGFVLRFIDAGRSVPPIDEYEDFVPGIPSPYRRVLIPIAGDPPGTAWTYIAPPGPPDAELRPIACGVWRPRNTD
jgi:hypothetical protein